jgi:ferredoxin--NADP+ reductase
MACPYILNHLLNIYTTIKSESIIPTTKKTIQQIRFLTDSTFVLRFERDDIQFIAGQHVIVGLAGSLNQREYSIYSSEQDNYIEILVKEVKEGSVSLQLRNCKPGDLLEVNGPFGYFKLETKDMYSIKHMFIATGTGISPFHSFVKSYPGIDYTILHGISTMHDAYEKNEYDQERYFPCVSREKTKKYNGRVTEFLPDFPDKPDTLYYLCGSGSMIYDVKTLLAERGVSRDRILMEVYF